MLSLETHTSIERLRAQGHKLALVKERGPKLCSLHGMKYNILMDLTYSEYMELSERGVYEIKSNDARSKLHTH